MTRKKTTIDYVKSSGNVFADLGLPHPERALLKAGLTLEIDCIINARHLTEVQASEILGITRPHAALLLHNRSVHFSVLAPFPVDQATVRWSSGHRNVGSSAAPVSLRWTITGMRTTATNIRRARPRAVKMSLQFSRVLTTPACRAGVLVSRPNFNARCGRMKL